MAPPASSVKTRRYDVSRRRAAEQARRVRVLEQARHLLLGQGYAATTITEIAANAEVSVETVYRMFGGKSGLVRALCQQALAGEAAEPAESRSDRLQASAGSGADVVRGWTDLMAEVSPRISPLHLLLRASAANDPGLTELLRALEDARLERMAHNARGLMAAGGIRPGVTVEHASEVLWLYSAPEWYERLVLERGWSVRAYADFVGSAIAAALLESHPEQVAALTPRP